MLLRGYSGSMIQGSCSISTDFLGHFYLLQAQNIPCSATKKEKQTALKIARNIDIEINTDMRSSVSTRRWIFFAIITKSESENNFNVNVHLSTLKLKLLIVPYYLGL